MKVVINPADLILTKEELIQLILQRKPSPDLYDNTLLRKAGGLWDEWVWAKEEIETWPLSHLQRLSDLLENCWM